MLRPVADATLADSASDAALPGAAVHHLRQILLWPLRLVPPPASDGPRRTPWQILRDLGDASPWHESFDEYTGDKARFHERHNNEFVTFLP